MRRAVVVLLVLAGVLAAPAAAQSPSFQKDSASDGRGKLDIVRVALARATTAACAARSRWRRRGRPPTCATAAGPSGSICLQLYTKRAPGEDPRRLPRLRDARRRSGDELRGRVLRDRANGLPRQVGAATVTRPTARTVYLRFAQSAIERPASVRFAGEAVTRGREVPEAARLSRHRTGRSQEPEI